MGWGMVAENSTVCRRLGQDGFNVLPEAHVEHLVGLVQDHHPQAAQTQGAPAQMVHNPARSTDDKVGALLELEDLLLHGSAAIDSHDLDALLVPGELLHLSGGLHGQLPGGTERQHLDALEVGIDHLNGRQAKGCGLAGTGMGTTDHILPLQDQRDALGLDGGGLGVADFGYGTLDGFGQRKITECNAHNTSF